MIPLKSLDAGRFVYNLIILFKNEICAERIMNIIESAVCVCLIAFLILMLINKVVNPSFIMLTVMLVATTVIELVR
jgi:membrane-associated protease RseP (regulator of RpoE activity)